MKNKQVHKIIYSFWGKRFQEKLQMRFRFWMRTNTNQEDKEKAMRNIWEQAPSVVTENTWKNLARIKGQITESNEIPVSKKRSLRTLQKYAAIILLAVCSCTSGIWIHSLIDKEITPRFTECFVPYGEHKEIILPDGSSVYINAGSVLVYPENFQGEERYVYLTGEARFKVVNNQQQPFIVRTDQLDIEVLGTIFNVQAYPDKEKIVTTLEEGSIQVQSKSKIKEKYIIKPNEQLVYSRDDHSMEIHKVEAIEYSSWKDGFLRFENCRFEEIIYTLERKYKVKIHYDQQKFKGRYYKITFSPDETLDEALHVMTVLIKDFNYERVDNTIFIN